MRYGLRGAGIAISAMKIASSKSQWMESCLLPSLQPPLSCSRVSRFIRAESACRYVYEREPALETFLHGHPTGRKLALILALSDQGPVLYSDHDVLAFSPPHELLASIRRNVACYFPEEVDGTRDLSIVERAKSLGLDYIPGFNSGFLYIPCGALPMKKAAEILATWRPPGEFVVYRADGSERYAAGCECRGASLEPIRDQCLPPVLLGTGCGL